MTTESILSSHSLQKPFRRNIIPNGVLGMIFLLFTEIMFFGGLISAYLVDKAGYTWPPADQPRLPIEITGINTAFLLISAVTVLLSVLALKKNNNRQSVIFLFLTIILGLVFVTIQGSEWVRLIGYGLTTSSSIYGAFFYTIIGAHAAHVIAGVCVLFYMWRNIRRASKNREDAFDIGRTCSLYWYFVVGIWPLLYYLVYLS